MNTGNKTDDDGYTSKSNLSSGHKTVVRKKTNIVFIQLILPYLQS